MKNLAELIIDSGNRFPNHKFSMAGSDVTLGHLIETAGGVVGLLKKSVLILPIVLRSLAPTRTHTWRFGLHFN